MSDFIVTLQDQDCIPGMQTFSFVATTTLADLFADVERRNRSKDFAEIATGTPKRVFALSVHRDQSSEPVEEDFLGFGSRAKVTTETVT